MIFVIILDAILFLKYLTVEKKDRAAADRILRVALIVAGLWGLLSNLLNSSDWNYSTTTLWMIRGLRTSGPGENFLAALLGNAILVLIISYVLARIIHPFIMNRANAKHCAEIAGSTEERYVRLREKYPYLYAKSGGAEIGKCRCVICGKQKRASSDFPSKICGERICLDCTDAIGIKKLTTEQRAAAYEQTPPFEHIEQLLLYLEDHKEAA